VQATSVDHVTAYQEVLDVWLRWNQGYETLTERMYQARHDPARVEALAEELDRLRHQAVAMSRQLLHRES